MSTNYEQYIAANQSLMDCMASVPAETYSAMSLNEQQNVCKNEANAVRSLLEGGHVNFKNILAERINSLKHKQEWMLFLKRLFKRVIDY